MNDAEKLMAQFPELTYKFEPLMPEHQDGLIIGDTVYLRPGQSTVQLAATISEEIAHYLTSVGDISNQDSIESRKQEKKARDIGAILLVTPFDIIDCFEAGCEYVWQCAEHLQVPEKTFTDAIKWYARKWDGIKTENGYIIIFRKNGTLGVFKPFY